MIERRISVGRQRWAIALPRQRWSELRRKAKSGEDVILKLEIGTLVLTSDEVMRLLEQPGRHHERN